VLGNHDHEHEEEDVIRQVLREARVTILEGESTVIDGIGLAGIKGFGGGFDNRMLSMFGEKTVKDFVQAAVDEELRLESALNRLYAEHNEIPVIVLMHYAPISATIIGEPEQIWPFLGCTRLVQPINKMNVQAVFHGHAHSGTFRGETLSGVPVYNVSYPLLLRDGMKQGYYVYEVQTKV
jgi:Icc-related predicted phosphoesterase